MAALIVTVDILAGILIGLKAFRLFLSHVSDRLDQQGNTPEDHIENLHDSGYCRMDIFFITIAADILAILFWLYTSLR